MKRHILTGHDDGLGHYSVVFPGKKIARIMTTNVNRQSISHGRLDYVIAEKSPAATLIFG